MAAALAIVLWGYAIKQRKEEIRVERTYIGNENRRLQSNECVKAVALCDYG
jgi:hypothetical protein